MSNKAVFLDRDGTINIEKDYLYKVEEFEFLPGVIEALRLLQENGFLLVVITNQSGIARGYYKEEDFLKLNDWMLAELKAKRVNVAKVYYCPHHPEAKIERYRSECGCRKPKLGMYTQAIEELNLNVDECYAIGDKIRDCAICEKTNCRGFLIAGNEKQAIIDSVKAGDVKNVRYASDLLEAAKRIVSQ